MAAFHGPVRVPDEAGNGKAKVTVSFPEWKEGKVAPATFEVPVVDTSGCGDAFSAGFLRGVGLGLDLTGAAELGCATAAHVVQGVGTDHGSYTLDAVREFVAQAARLESQPV